MDIVSHAFSSSFFLGFSLTIRCFRRNHEHLCDFLFVKTKQGSKGDNKVLELYIKNWLMYARISNLAIFLKSDTMSFGSKTAKF